MPALIPIALVLGVLWLTLRKPADVPVQPEPKPLAPDVPGWDANAVADAFCQTIVSGQGASAESITQAIAMSQWPSVGGQVVQWSPTGPVQPVHPAAVQLWSKTLTFVIEALRDPDAVCVTPEGTGFQVTPTDTDPTMLGAAEDEG